jgi:hypothetical protein
MFRFGHRILGLGTYLESSFDGSIYSNDLPIEDLELGISTTSISLTLNITDKMNH